MSTLEAPKTTGVITMRQVNEEKKAKYEKNLKSKVPREPKKILGPSFRFPSFSDYYGSGKHRWVIYPSYWKKSWGEVPVLGTVLADDEFYAKREAYNKGLLIMNSTFEAKAVKTRSSRKSDEKENHD